MLKGGCVAELSNFRVYNLLILFNLSILTSSIMKSYIIKIIQLYSEKNLAFFTIMFMKFIHVLAYNNSLFILLAPLYGYTTIYIFIPLVMDIGFFLLWVFISGAAMNTFCTLKKTCIHFCCMYI